MAKKCTFTVRGKACGAPSVPRSNPPLCEEHDFYEEDEDYEFDRSLVDDAIDQVVTNPKVQGVLEKAAGLFDKFAQVLDRATRAQAQTQNQAPPKPQRPFVRRENPREVMGFDKAAVLTEQIIKERKKALASLMHPDKPGGSVEAMARINAAADALLATLKK